MSSDDFDRIHSKLDRIEVKLDDHLGRISRTEEAIEWLKKHVAGVTTVGATLFMTLIGFVIKLFGWPE